MAELENVAPETETPEQLTDEQLDAALRQTEEAPEEVAEPAEPKPEAKADEEPEQKKVDLRALHEERERRKNAERQLQTERQQIAATMQEWRRQAQEMQAQLQRTQAPPPDPTQDPLGASLYQQQFIAQQVDGLHQRLNQQEQAAAQRAQANRVIEAVTRQEDAFRQHAPDYDQAIAFAKQRRMAEYVALGSTQQDAEAQVQREAWQIGMTALQRGDNPAEVAYQFAKASGYVPPSKKMDMQQAGQKAAKPTGAQTQGRISLEALAAMDGDEFDKIASDPREWKRLWGA